MSYLIGQHFNLILQFHGFKNFSVSQYLNKIMSNGFEINDYMESFYRKVVPMLETFYAS